MQIGDRIRKLRGNELQASFAAKLGVHKNTLGRWERGERFPDSNDLVKIIECYPDINASWLITGEGGMYFEETATGKNDFKLDELGVNVIQSIIETATGDSIERQRAKKFAHMSIDLISLIAELRTTLPTVDEIKSIILAFEILRGESENHEPKGLSRILENLVRGPEK